MGYNSRLDELQAAILRAKLKRLDEWNENRRKVAVEYSERLRDLDLVLPQTPSFAEPVWHLYVVRSKQREKLQSSLSSKGIGTIVHYPIPPHRQHCYAGQGWSDLPICEMLAEEVLSLPIYPGISEGAVDCVVAAIKSLA
jgi:dTDP-4-amino-4,6-dideoxygalactose transaminase